MNAARTEPKAVFINCPFDNDYIPLLRVIVFTVARCGFQPRCALEVNNAAQVRINKISDIIKECQIGIHDISRTQLDAINGLPRFNMPLELGLYLGARYFGDRTHKNKSCLILDCEPYRYQKFISDISGQDIASHGNNARETIKVVRDFLNGHNGPQPLTDRDAILREYEDFLAALTSICRDLNVEEAEIQYSDYLYMISQFIKV